MCSCVTQAKLLFLLILSSANFYFYKAVTEVKYPEPRIRKIKDDWSKSSCRCCIKISTFFYLLYVLFLMLFPSLEDNTMFFGQAHRLAFCLSFIGLTHCLLQQKLDYYFVCNNKVTLSLYGPIHFLKVFVNVVLTDFLPWLQIHFSSCKPDFNFYSEWLVTWCKSKGCYDLFLIGLLLSQLIPKTSHLPSCNEYALLI